jgi:predicted DNA-binding antitoxin AbrB/MazE fold protein
MFLSAQFIDGMLKPLSPLPFGEGEVVELEVKTRSEPNADTQATEEDLKKADEFNAILDRIAAMTPPGAPTDGSYNHDHYLYGAPRRDRP